MPSSAIETIRQLFEKVKAGTQTDLSALFEEMIQLFAVLSKEDQKNFSTDFCKWAGKYKTRFTLAFCHGQHFSVANNFFSENYEAVLAEGPDLQKAYLECDELATAAVIGAFIGGTHRTLGNVDHALKSLWEAYRQLNKLNRFPHYKMSCSFNIGSIYLDLNNLEEALPILSNTLSQAEKTGDSTFIIYTSHSLGRLYLKQKNYENARLMFQKAVDAAYQTGSPQLLSSAQTEMGNYYFETGNYDESETLHTRSVDIRIENNFVGGAITNYIRLGEINIKQAQPDEAIAVLNKGLALAEQIKVWPKMYQIHLLLSEIYHGKNDLNRSLFHYKQYHCLREQVGQEDNAKRIKNVKLVFEAEQTKKENVIIKKQKAEIQKKNAELQHTIDELTLTKAGKKAKAFTLFLAIVLFIFEDSILHFVLPLLPAENFWISLSVKIIIIFSLKPINGIIEHYLIRKVIRKKQKILDESEEEAEEISAEIGLTN